MTDFTQTNNIESIRLEQTCLSILFKQEWFQEDISVLKDLLLLPIMPVVIQEKNKGADREDIRFNWQASYFVLNFDYYSQSCWIEGQDDESAKFLSKLYAAINAT